MTRKLEAAEHSISGASADNNISNGRIADDPDEALPKPRLCEKCAFHPRFGWMRDAAQKLRPGAELRGVRHLYDWLAEQDRKKK